MEEAAAAAAHLVVAAVKRKKEEEEEEADHVRQREEREGRVAVEVAYQWAEGVAEGAAVGCQEEEEVAGGVRGYFRQREGEQNVLESVELAAEAALLRLAVAVLAVTAELEEEEEAWAKAYSQQKEEGKEPLLLVLLLLQLRHRLANGGPS